jgi:hypothetical protein
MRNERNNEDWYFPDDEDNFSETLHNRTEE